MTQKEQCTVRLLNRSYTIKCSSAERDNLKLAAVILQERLAEKKNQFKHLDDFHTLLLTALHLSHEVVTRQDNKAQQREQLTQFIHSLESKISQITEDD